MTIVAALNSQFDAVILADARLSWPDSRGRLVTKRDVCQKLIAPNGWSVVGFAGALCMARHIFNAVAKRLMDTSHEDPGWLKDDDELRRFVGGCVDAHRRVNSSHQACRGSFAEILVVWMDYTGSIVTNGPFTPGVVTVSIRTPDLTVRRSTSGVHVIGSGSKIATALQSEMLAIANVGRGVAFGDEHRCLAAGMRVRDLLTQAHVTTVGGMYQLFNLSPLGVRVVPHFYWIEVEPGYGTYVAMRIKDGWWLQEHRPTGNSVTLQSPFAIHLGGPKIQHNLAFDPARSLRRGSPGVILQTYPWHIVAAIYEPSDVPASIKQSWGDKPLAPITFRTGPPKRGRRVV